MSKISQKQEPCDLIIEWLHAIAGAEGETTLASAWRLFARTLEVDEGSARKQVRARRSEELLSDKENVAALARLFLTKAPNHDWRLAERLYVATGMTRDDMPEDLQQLVRQREEQALEALGIRPGWDGFYRDLGRLEEYSRLISRCMELNIGLPVARADAERSARQLVWIDRALSSVLRKIADEGSLLVIGAPGTGKSGLLLHLAKELLKERADLVYIAADHLAAQGLDEFCSQLHLETDLPQLLSRWHRRDRKAAFLIIDSLEAAGSARRASALRELMQMTLKSDREWHVIASIRSYDLRHDEEVQEIFASVPRITVSPELCDPRFCGLPHLRVPPLTDEELRQLSKRAPEIFALVDRMSTELTDLLRTPFFLRLMTGLVSPGATMNAPNSIRTSADLLNRYWEKVISPGQYGDARERVLRNVCQEMLRGRELLADRARVVMDANDSGPLYDLLSANVLAEWWDPTERQPDRSLLTFGHDMLFEYAAARLLLRGAPDSPISRLAADPDNVLFMGRLLEMHLEYLWTLDTGHRRFWELLFQLQQDSRIPDLGKSIGPTIAARRACKELDLDALCAALVLDNRVLNTAAEQVLSYLVKSHFEYLPTPAYVLMDAEATLWCGLLERATRNLHPVAAWAVRPLLDDVCDHLEYLSREQAALVGMAARRLLAFAISLHSSEDSGLVTSSLRAVCRTVEGEPGESDLLIRRALELPQPTLGGLALLAGMRDELGWLISYSPQLMAEIYALAFQFEDDRERLPMLADVRITLTGLFPRFLSAHLEHAMRALAAAIRAHSLSQASSPSEHHIEGSIELGAVSAHLQADGSSKWDDTAYYRYGPSRMLDAFEAYLESLVDRRESQEALHEVVKIVALTNRYAAAWRRLLAVAARFPSTLGMAIRPLAWAPAVLLCVDTTRYAGEYLRTVFPMLGVDERESIERILLMLPQIVPDGQAENAERTRDRLLGCLDLSCLVLDASRTRLEALLAADQLPENALPPRSGDARLTYSVFVIPESARLAAQGVSLPDKSARRLYDLTMPVVDFYHKHGPSVSNHAEAVELSSMIQGLHIALEDARATSVAIPLYDWSWGWLTTACMFIAQSFDPQCDGLAQRVALPILLSASRHPSPLPDMEKEAQFESDAHSYADEPIPRANAAAGLVAFARRPGLCTSEIVSAVDRLSADVVPLVRYQIAFDLARVRRSAPELMWSLLERLSSEETSCAVLLHVVARPLTELATVYPERVAELLARIYQRLQPVPATFSLRAECLSLCTMLYLVYDAPAAGELVFAALNDMLSAAVYVQESTSHLAQALGCGAVSLVLQADSKTFQVGAPVQDRAFAIVEQLVSLACPAVHTMIRNGAGILPTEWSEAERETWYALVEVLAEIGKCIHGASMQVASPEMGDWELGGPDYEILSPELLSAEQTRFYARVEPLLGRLARTSLEDPVKCVLKVVLLFTPKNDDQAARKALLLAGEAMESGKRWGCEYRADIACPALRLLEFSVREYPGLMSKDADCRRVLLSLLSMEVRAGWPGAETLASSARNVFRIKRPGGG